MILDPSISGQTYIEDCEICCNPMEVQVEFGQEEMKFFEVRSIEQ